MAHVYKPFEMSNGTFTVGGNNSICVAVIHAEYCHISVGGNNSSCVAVIHAEYCHILIGGNNSSCVAVIHLEFVMFQLVETPPAV